MRKEVFHVRRGRGLPQSNFILRVRGLNGQGCKPSLWVGEKWWKCEGFIEGRELERLARNILHAIETNKEHGKELR